MNVLNTKAGPALIYVAAAGVLVYVIYRVVKSVAPKVAEAVDITSDTNLAYRGVNAVGTALTGDPSWSLGSWLYDQFNPPYDPNTDYQKPNSKKVQIGQESEFYRSIAQ
jgi:hypothetical protein